jgi:hypothetical protein
MECPVDFVTINENKVRVIAFFVLTLAVVYLLTDLRLIMAFLVADFLLRAFNLGKYSLLGFLADAIIKQLKIKPKPVDRAPKRFAAIMGLVFTISILLLAFLHFIVLANILTVILCCFATLESFAGFCAGCYVYSAGKLLFK